MTLPRGPEFHDWDAFNATEAPVMDEFDAINRVIARVESDIFDDRESIVRAAKALWNLSLSGADRDSTAWHMAEERLFDAVDRLPQVFDIGWPVADEETIARGMFEGGAL